MNHLNTSVEDLLKERGEFVGPPKPIRVIVVGGGEVGLDALTAVYQAHFSTPTPGKEAFLLAFANESEHAHRWGLGTLVFEGETAKDTQKLVESLRARDVKVITDYSPLTDLVRALSVFEPLTLTATFSETSRLGEQVSPYGPQSGKVSGRLRQSSGGNKKKKGR